MSIDYTIEKEIGQIGQTTQGARKLLSLVSWNGRPAKYDLRSWHMDDNGNLKPGKGITFSEDEARALLSVLDEHFGD